MGTYRCGGLFLPTRRTAPGPALAHILVAHMAMMALTRVRHAVDRTRWVPPRRGPLRGREQTPHRCGMVVGGCSKMTNSWRRLPHAQRVLLPNGYQAVAHRAGLATAYGDHDHHKTSVSLDIHSQDLLSVPHHAHGLDIERRLERPAECTPFETALNLISSPLMPVPRRDHLCDQLGSASAYGPATSRRPRPGMVNTVSTTAMPPPTLGTPWR